MHSTPQTARDARRYHIWTLGCQMNEADSRRLEQQLQFAGYEAAARPEDADLVVLNTCVVRQQPEDKAAAKLQHLGAMKRRRPGLVLGLMGCMVGMREAPALRRRFPFVDVFMPPSDTAPLVDFLAGQARLEAAADGEARARALRDAALDGDLPLPPGPDGAPVTAHVPVVLGCSHACAFCVIPYRRGAERSRPAEEILREVRSLARQGVREVTLLGQIVDRYGLDRPGEAELPELLRRAADVDGLERVRFLTSHPNYMTDGILRAVAETPRVCPHVEVPVQAGNDEVLAAMRRGYTAAQYRDLVARIRDRLPDAAIHTDIIVGFPGETPAQFEDTLALLADLSLDKVHVSPYSERPKTLAARRLPDDVPEPEKKRRWQAVEDLQRSILARKNEALRGQTVHVLVEERQKGRWRGRTAHARVAVLEDDRDLRGRVIPMIVEWSSAYGLTGRAADAPPRACMAPAAAERRP